MSLIRSYRARIRWVAALIVVSALTSREVVAATHQAMEPAPQSTSHPSGCGMPEEARRVVMDRGERHAFVKLCSGKKLQGRILEISDDHFLLDPRGPAAPIAIAYGDVRQFDGLLLLKDQPPPRKGVRILVGVLVAAGLIAQFIQCHDQSC